MFKINILSCIRNNYSKQSGRLQIIRKSIEKKKKEMVCTEKAFEYLYCSALQYCVFRSVVKQIMIIIIL